jgi:hypothetical protein
MFSVCQLEHLCSCLPTSQSSIGRGCASHTQNTLPDLRGRMMRPPASAKRTPMVAHPPAWAWRSPYLGMRASCSSLLLSCRARRIGQMHSGLRHGAVNTALRIAYRLTPSIGVQCHR